VTGLEFWAPSDSVDPPIGGYGVRLIRLWSKPPNFCRCHEQDRNQVNFVKSKTEHEVKGQAKIQVFCSGSNFSKSLLLVDIIRVRVGVHSIFLS